MIGIGNSMSGVGILKLEPIHIGCYKSWICQLAIGLDSGFNLFCGQNGLRNTSVKS